MFTLIATTTGLAFAWFSGIGAAAMIYGDYRSRHQYGENWDCMVICLLGACVFWPSFLISAVLLAIGSLKRDLVAAVGLVVLAAIFALCWFVLPR